VAETVPGQSSLSAENSQFTAPQIALPTGGGAIRGIGEKFAANAVTGTGSLSVPIAVSPSRSGFSPQLSLNYDSGLGNGAFGVGWNLALAAITRKTEKGIPQYRDLEESDVFLMSDVDDLVPVLHEMGDGQWVYTESERDGYLVRLYRPRIEGLFARIERWSRMADGDTHWRSFTKDNVLTYYGNTSESRISDPSYPTHTFKWLISASYDTKGNAIHYEYVSENDRGVDLSRPSEHRRSRSANRYLKRIKYGNRKPLQRDPADLEAAEWMFEVVFDFGEEDYRDSAPDNHREAFVHLAEGTEETAWPARKDPFSAYRSGFEVRTHRLCRRALLFHHFPEELGTRRYLVRSTSFEHREKPFGSFLTRVVQSGYALQGDGRYLRRSLPPLDLSYTPSPLEDDAPGPFELLEADPRNLPEGIDGKDYRWLDLDGEGIAGVLSKQGNGWYYKHNLGHGRFGTATLVSRKPSTAAINSGNQQLMDVVGDGNLDLVELAAGSAGFYERSFNSEGPHALWGRFRAFQSFPVLDWSDPNLRFVDLTGDGIADILITEDVAIRWHPSLLSRGFGHGTRIPAPHDEDEGPRVVFADRTQSIYLADMSGDGLSDIVRIRNGEVCYWPNLGYGRFGCKLVMDRAPWFDAPNLFDQRRVALADTDGSGTTDILYLGDDGIQVYLNESGNGWTERKILRGVPSTDPRSTAVADFLGRGTACIVWSSPLRADSGRPLRYVDLMRSQKPHLLTRIVNNLGAETVVEYASSTEFYLADQAAGEPWVTRLPFPVSVVKRVETYDYVSRNRFVTSSTYHHGYYDGVEREFRGFARVEQTDSEDFDTLSQGGKFPSSTNEDAAWSIPPVLTKTWYHTGVFLGLDRVSRHLAHEYYREPHETSAMQLDDTVLPYGLTPEEAREACRALKGSMLRQEVYALDESEESARPYTVSENNATVRMLQPRARNRHGVFFAHTREAVVFNYERKLYDIGGVRRADPRVSHAVTLEVDDYGNVLESVGIGYGRRFPDKSELLTDSDLAKQSRILATLTANRFTQALNERNNYLAPYPAEAQTYELVHLHPRSNQFGVTNLFRFDQRRRLGAEASDGHRDLPFEDFEGVGAAGTGPYRRLFQQSRIFYRRDDLSRLLPLSEIGALALPGESYRLILTPGLIEKVYRRNGEDLLPHKEALLRNDCGYADLDRDGHWWVPSGRVYYSPDADDAHVELEYARRHFFVARRYLDPFGNTTTVTYDAQDLSPVETRDAIGNVVHSRLDYRVLRPWQVTDVNGNRAEVAFDALGMVTGTAVMGKEGQNLGDSLQGFEADLPEHVILEHIRDPFHDPHRILGNASTRLIYDLFAFDRSRGESQPQPAVSYTLAREAHVSDLAPGQNTKIQHSFSYSDAFGREIQKKIQAEPGPVPGHAGEVDPRWTGSGWTIFNNKGKPVRKYEPFFSATHHFEFAAITGVSPTLYYDPAGRAVATLQPNHTFEKVVFDPWRQESWDVNDTVLENPRQDPDVGEFLRQTAESDYLPTWYAEREGGALGPAQQDAAKKAAQHARTPGIAYADSLGRVFLSILHNRFDRSGETLDQFYATRSRLDIQGNQLAVIDALDRVSMTFDYDVAGTRIHQDSADAGQRWTLYDATKKPVLSYDNRDHRFRREYDVLRRPLTLYVRTGEAQEKLVERAGYGESQPDPEARNLRTKLYRQFDEAGIVTMVEYDFKGNLLQSSRQLLSEYREEVDWAASPSLEAEVFYSETSYDALNRPLTLTAPDHSVIRPTYNDANLLEELHVNLKGTAGFAPFVTNIQYNAKGQRERIEYANGAHTTSTYDPLTFRLVHVKTLRASDNADLQNLAYAYDPVGNITSIADAAQQTVYFKNQVVSASGHYVYDAIYRLFKAEGREHAGNTEHPQTSYNDVPRVHLSLPDDGQAMRNYREQYRYDAVGNILEVLHSAGTDGSWKRHYDYGQIESNNRLTKTSVGQSEDRYTYDPHGNITRMQHLPSMRWDFRDQLASTQAQVVNEGIAETTYYVYDSGGQRARKITDDASGKRRAERMYLGGFEIYREYSGDSVSLERTTLHIMDDKRRVALVETRNAESNIRYQFDNHLGSACLELDEAAAVITYEEYYPYGCTSYQAGRTIAEVSLKRYRFIGKERDEETGFYYHGARYYAPWVGRWTACDPSGPQDGFNLYLYVNDNPVNKVDMTGNWEISWTDVAIGAVTAVVIVGAVALTAGAAAPLIAGGLAAAGVEAGTISALGSAVVLTGATVGVVGTVDTAAEVATGRNPVTGEKISDQQRSRELGALPVQIIGSALGLRGISGGGGGGSSGLNQLVPAVATGLSEENTIGPLIKPLINAIPALTSVTAAPATAGTLLGTGSVPIAMNMMSGGDNNSGNGSNSGGDSSSGSGNIEPSSTPEPPPTSEDIGPRINSLPEEQQARILARVGRGDNKGRPFGTPRNPRLPTIEEFNPRIEEVRAGDLEELVTGTKHGIFPEQAESIKGLSNEDLVRFRMEDPISATRGEKGLALTGGHHRTAEVISRVNAGKLDPNTIVRVLVHD
jgi:RHS repeat-associated protein